MIRKDLGVIRRISGCDQRVFRMTVTLSLSSSSFLSHIYQKRAVWWFFFDHEANFVKSKITVKSIILVKPKFAICREWCDLYNHSFGPQECGEVDP